MFDKLQFSVDGVTVKSIDGEKNWTEVTYEITSPGAHALRWTYSKDVTGGSGQDCGWVDEVVWTPEGGD